MPKSSLKGSIWIAGCALICASTIGHAQGSGSIVGRVVDQDARPIAGAQVTLTPGARHAISDEQGTIRVLDLAPATYSLAARRIGYQATNITVVVRTSDANVTIRLVAVSRQLDSVRVVEKVSGLRYSAVVLDLNSQPVIGAEVVAMGIDSKVVTDSLGRFSVGRLGQQTLVVRLRKIGYQATTNSIRLLGDRADTIYMPRLAQALSKVEINDRSGFGMDETAYADMEQRQRWKNPLSGIISREELDAKGMQDLCDAMPATASGAKLTLHNDPNCKTSQRTILIDGTRCVTRALGSFTADEVEMIEVFVHPKLKEASLAPRDCVGSSSTVKASHSGGASIPDFTLTADIAIWMRTKESGMKPIVTMPRTLVGVVYDSIAKRPLGGAHVTIEDLKRETVANSLGAFRFDSVASGVHELKAEHETLGQIGWPALRDTIDLTPELRTNVTLAIPSFATLWKRVCSDSVPPQPAEGLVYGRVLLGPAAVASTDTSGTVVEASWRGVVSDSARDAAATRQVPADSAGNYAVCGAPTTMPMTLSALSHGTATVSLSFSIGDARIARRDLILPAADIIDRLVADSTSIPPLPTGEGSTVAGIVHDSLGKPIADVHISVTGVTGEWRTNEKGRFVVRGIPGGARVVGSTQVGFLAERRLVDLNGTDSIGVDLSMSRVSTYLDTMKIAGKQSARTSTLLDIASRRKLGIGYSSDSSKLERLPGAGLRDAFSFPSVRTGQGKTGLWIIYMTDHARSLNGDVAGPGCQPKIYVDGAPSNIDFLNDMTKEEIGLIEVFTSPSRAPSEYAGSGSNCGIVLIWRKRYLRP